MTRSFASWFAVSTLSLALPLVSGCKSVEEPKGTPKSTSAPAGAASAPAHPTSTPPASPHTPGAPGTLPKAAITWKAPAGWEEQPRRSPMRQATYVVPGKTGPAETAVFYFGPNQGGGVQANMERWIGQFKDWSDDAVRRDTREVNGMKAYTVSLTRGTYSSGMPGGPQGPQENWGLMGAIVETPSGSYFFKMTGPADTVSDQRKAFLEMVDSISTKE